MQRSVAPLHDGWIVEPLPGRVLEVPRPAPCLSLIDRDGHREPIARAAFLVVVDQCEIAAREQDRFETTPGVWQRRRGQLGPGQAAIGRLAALNTVRGGAIPEERHETAVAQLHD